MIALSVVDRSIALPATLPKAEVSGLYVHVPFCFHKCHYCDFYSITRQSLERMDGFVDHVLQEANQWTDARRGPSIAPRTIFFGGGTPSLVPLKQMARLLDGLRRRFDFSNLVEWTFEANPATVTFEYCQMLREAGVNRISMGAQSFSKAELAMLERHHDPEDVPRSMEIARAAGFSRLNVDLIFAIPGQSMLSWQVSLETAIALKTPHISCYALTYETNTAMTVRRRLGHFEAIDDDTELAMLHYTRDRLIDAGVPPYEVSNFAAENEACQHNVNYWKGGNYVGLGPSAASHVNGWRWKNRPHLGEWEKAVDSGLLPAIETEHLSPRRRAGELAMLMLRLETGIVFSEFDSRSGYDATVLFADPIDRWSKTGLIEMTSTAVRLTRSGLNVADAIGSEFLLED